MLTLLIVTLAAVLPAQRNDAALDVRTLSPGSPTVIAEIDADTLQGEPRRLSWSPDGFLLYLQSVDGKIPNEAIHHFVVPRSGGVLTVVDDEPYWAVRYWNVKQDRAAPGVPTLVIEVEQKAETIKVGPGPAGSLDRTNPSAASDPMPSMPDLVNGTSGNQKAAVVRLKLLGQEIAKWVNVDKPIPGTRFGWGPSGSGAMVFLGAHGELILLDQRKHKRTVPDVKDALLPAWSLDGQWLAYLRKTGSDEYVLAWLALGGGRL
jgi:hypothetical protein